MTESYLTAAVITRLVAKRIEEETVDVILLETFGQNLHSLIAVIAAVDTDRVEAVVDHRFSVRLTKEPFRVRVEDSLMRLAEVVPSNHPDLARMALSQHVAKHIAPGGQTGAGVMKLHSGRVIRNNAAHAHQDYVGAHVGELFGKTFCIKCSVYLAKIGLQPANGLAHPPAFLPAFLRGSDGRQQTQEPQCFDEFVFHTLCKIDRNNFV